MKKFSANPQTRELTAFEVKVLRLATEGLTNKAIGARLNFAPKHIEKILGTSDPYRAIYPLIGVTNRKQAIAYYCENFGSPQAPTILPEMIEIARGSRDDVERFRLLGDLEYALQRSSALTNQLAICANNTPSEWMRREFLKIQAATLIEQQSTYKASCPRDKLFVTVTPIAAKVEQIAKECQSSHLFGLAHYSYGDTFYILRKYEQAIPHLKTALQNLDDLDSQLWAWRSLSLSFAYLNMPAEHERAEKQILALVAKHPHEKLEYVWMAYEGLSISQALLKQSRAFSTLQKAQHLAAVMKKQMRTAPFQEIATIGSELIIAKNLGVQDKAAFERLGNYGITLAAAQGYPRHQQQLQELLQAYL